mgnify:FL=1|tara:strand:- start:90 stop:365 length:276 start_codon:yes stop_codon:yes gene_type:complete
MKSLKKELKSLKNKMESVREALKENGFTLVSITDTQIHVIAKKSFANLAIELSGKKMKVKYRPVSYYPYQATFKVGGLEVLMIAKTIEELS